MTTSWKWLRTKKFGVDIAPVERQAAVAAPTGGSTTDAEARTAINAVIAVLVAYGMVEEEE
jgi:hypothetical protein